MTALPRRQRLTVILHPHELVHHHALATELLARARRAGLAGATVLEAMPEAAGEPTTGPVGGATGSLGEPGAKDGEPGVLWFVVVDQPEALARFVAASGDLLDGHPYTLDDVTAFRA